MHIKKGFEVLCPDSDAMRAQLDTAWHKARLRNGGQAGFILELYIYVPKPTKQVTTLRRATAALIQEQMPRVAGLLREQGIAAGPSTQTYMAVTQARLPDGAPLVVPNNTTFQQLQQVDAQEAAMEEVMQADQQLSNAEYHLVCINIQDVPVAMQVDISDIRAALGLPDYSLRPPFRAPTDVDTSAPEGHMEEIDHIDT
ncbi:hypothetical protein ON010_g11122 [Phytophthora cinnamomi]|nr:hypothetical protein ON010_g11122 [Phytophthora cinnamomi]